jgi:hypothetical protein
LLVSSIACFKPRHCNSNSNYTMDWLYLSL